jgi:putative intracellular protease/amidase
MGIRNCDVHSDGSLVINLTPDQAQSLAKELMNLARKGRFQ